jgi:hypothetical protein
VSSSSQVAVIGSALQASIQISVIGTADSHQYCQDAAGHNAARCGELPQHLRCPPGQ